MSKIKKSVQNSDLLLGKHAIVEYYGCDHERLDDIPLLRSALITAAETAGATVIDSLFHAFSPFGITGVVVVAESHLSIHTWPEYGYAAVDVFTCGETIDNHKAIDYLKAELAAQNYEVVEFKRGRVANCIAAGLPSIESIEEVTP